MTGCADCLSKRKHGCGVVSANIQAWRSLAGLEDSLAHCWPCRNSANGATITANGKNHQ